MGFEAQMPSSQETKKDDAELNLTSEEKAFMERANMNAAQLAQYKRWKKLDEELGGMDKAA